ncbi:MAG: hypothetical protein IPP86_00210 [Bacteroidetes bacterium]|nr:hypothetical protein [Bacteroidota bacterium]
MKKNKYFLLLIISLMFTSLCEAQKDTLYKSLLEKFSERSGSLMKREFFDVGKIRGMKIKMMKITNLTDPGSKTLSGARFECSTQYSDYIAFVDADELDGLIASLDFIQSKIFNDTAKTYTEVEFKTRGGFKSGCYFSQNDNKWSGYIQVASYSDKSMVFLEQEDFGKFKNMVEQVKELMKQPFVK